MKVRYIKNDGYGAWLTLGKIYEVFEIDKDGDYLIIGDEGYKIWCEKESFKTLSEIRNETINKLLEE